MNELICVMSSGTNQCDPDVLLSLRGTASSIPKSSGCSGIFPVMLCWLIMAIYTPTFEKMIITF